MIGDSNGDHIVPHCGALCRREQPRPPSYAQLVFLPCSVRAARNIAERKVERCRAFQQELLEFFDRHGEIKTVILGLAWARYDATTPDNGLVLPGRAVGPPKAAISPTISTGRFDTSSAAAYASS